MGFFEKYVYTSDKKEEKGMIEPPDFSQKGSPKQPPSFVQQSQPAYVPSATITATPTQANSEELQKYREHIKEVMRAANLEGPDYFEFFEAIERNKNLNLDPKTEIIVAFNSLVSLGLSKQKLIESANYYVTKLTEDLNQFNVAVETKKKKDVQGRADEIARLQADNQQKSEQIRKLTEEMSANNKRIEDLNAEKVSAEQKITNSAIAMQNEIKTEISRIQENIRNIGMAIQ
jgi:hypothetical protein